MVPRLVDPDELTAAGAIDALSRTIGMIAGPACAGLLLAGPGLKVAYAADAATFLVSLAALASMRPIPAPSDAERPSFARVVEGLRYARSRPELMGTYLVDMAAMFFGMPLALFPALAQRYGGSAALGALYAAPSVGAFLATLTSGWTGRVRRHGRAISVAAGPWGVAIIGFGLAPWLWLALLGLVLAGAADMVSGIFRLSMWNRTIPDHLRGRLASTSSSATRRGPCWATRKPASPPPWSACGRRWCRAASCAFWPWPPPPPPCPPSGPTTPGHRWRAEAPVRSPTGR
jgi:MFS family permease